MAGINHPKTTESDRSAMPLAPAETLPGDVFKLGRCRILPSLHRIERDGASMEVEPKTMAVLVMLAKRFPNVVSTDDLVQEIWQGRPMADNPVYGRIAKVRQVLGDDAKDRRYIETVRKAGYRLICTPDYSGGRSARNVNGARRAQVKSRYEGNASDSRRHRSDAVSRKTLILVVGIFFLVNLLIALTLPCLLQS